MIRDPEKNLFRIPDPWVKKAPDPGSRNPDPDLQHWMGEARTEHRRKRNKKEERGDRKTTKQH
jgi:hypothetical protein